MKALLKRASSSIAMLGAMLLAMAIVGCASLGVPSPDTLAQKVGYAHTSLSIAADTAKAAYQANKLTFTEAKSVEQDLNTAWTALVEGQKLIESKPLEAQTKLDAVLTGLKALRAYLASKGA